MIMGSLKSPKRNKWYMCFRPDDADYPFKPVSCLGKGGKERMLPHKILVTLSDDNLDSSSDGEDRLSKKSKSRRGFSRVLKAVLFQSSLTKKTRSRKSGQETSFRSSSCHLSPKLDKIFNSFRDKKSQSYKDPVVDYSLRTDSSRSSLFSSSTTAASSSLSSSRASSIASNSRSASERKRSCSIDLKQLNQKPTISSKRTGGCYNSNVGLYFLLICLVGLVFWGKAFAIFCMSTCLFLIPCRFKGIDQSAAVNNADSLDMDSDEYKKKVIMEGLLERNRITSRIL